MNYNFLAAKNYWKKAPKEVQTGKVAILAWNVCKVIGKRTYNELPALIAEFNSSEKYRPLGCAIAHWHNQRMWQFVENGYENISMDNLKKLGIITPCLDADLKNKGYMVKEGFVFPKREVKARSQIDPVAELGIITDVMKSLEAT